MAGTVGIDEGPVGVCLFQWQSCEVLTGDVLRLCMSSDYSNNVFCSCQVPTALRWV